MTRYTLYKFGKWLSNTWSVLCNHKNKIIHSSVSSLHNSRFISQARWTRHFARNECEARDKGRIRTCFALCAKCRLRPYYVRRLIKLHCSALYASYSVPVLRLLLITGQEELTGSMASMVTYNSQNSSFGVNLDQGKRNLVPVTENFGLSKVEFAEWKWLKNPREMVRVSGEFKLSEFELHLGFYCIFWVYL